MPAAAHPEYEFSIEITTGMSAPPIGTISRKPSANDTKRSSQKAGVASIETKSAISRIKRAPSAALTRCCPGKTNGRPVTSPCNLAKATTEPVKVIAPIAMPSDISTRLLPWIAPRTPMP